LIGRKNKLDTKQDQFTIGAKVHVLDC